MKKTFVLWNKKKREGKKGLSKMRLVQKEKKGKGRKKRGTKSPPLKGEKKKVRFSTMQWGGKEAKICHQEKTVF